MFRHILLASHGTEGAIAAEDMAIQMCAPHGRIDHVIVVPEFWQSMTGDDWLNSGVARDQFRDYLQTALGQEIDQQCARVNNKISSHGLACRSVVLSGKPDQALLHQANAHMYDLIVIGSPRSGGRRGALSLRSTMLTKKIFHNLTVAVLIAPYPMQ